MADLPILKDSPLEDQGWCALYTRHQHEKTVSDMLTAKNFEVFLPLYNSMRRWKDRNKMISLPLFPGYVFVRGARTRRLEVVVTPGVHMILCVGDRVAIISDIQIEAIRRAVTGPHRVEPHPFLKCGERVRVNRGALEGMEGILVRKKNQCRLVLSVETVAQSIGVEIDAADVEPVTTRHDTGRSQVQQFPGSRRLHTTSLAYDEQRRMDRKVPITREARYQGCWIS